MNPFIELEAADAALRAIYATCPQSSDLGELVRLMGVYGELLYELAQRTRSPREVEAEKIRTGLKAVQPGTGNPHKLVRYNPGDPIPLMP